MAIIQFQVSAEDIDKAAKGGGSTLPAGQYRLRVESKDWTPPKEAGKYPNLVLKCKVLTSFNGQNIDKTITRRFNMHPKSIPYNLARFLQAAGIAYQYTPQGAIIFDDDHVLGVVTDVTCKITKGDQRDFEEWENDAPIGPTQQVTPQSPPMQQGGFAPPQGGWTPPGQQSFSPPMQQPQVGPPQGWVPPVQQPMAAPQGYPQQPMQPSYAPPVQPMQQPPQNGGQPAWLQGPPVQQQPYNPQQHVAGQGPMPPRGNG